MTHENATKQAGSLSAKAASYAGMTVAALTAIQWLTLHPKSPLEIAVIVLPFFVCTGFTYVITRAIVRRRAQSLTSLYLAFQRPESDVPPPFPADAEFREARDLVGQLRRAQQALKQRDEERRRLFADVVHELGTPVSSLLGLGEAFARPALSGTPEQRERLSRSVLRESERLARFIEDLRDLAQLDDPAMKLVLETIDLGELARDVVERLNAIPDTTSVELLTTRAGVRADPARLEQVLVNLVTNARRYARPPAPIRVSIGCKGERVTLMVEDGGPGVDDSDLPKLGERMHRLDKSRTRSTGGTGLGLSIVGAIAEKHAGKVAFRRSGLGGLSVEVTLPKAI
jgi:signal transduction histidine kinase